MKTLIKFVMLLVVLGICLSAQAEILVYSVITKNWAAEDMGSENWDIYRDKINGFLILDLIIEEGQITGFNNTMHIDYGRDGNEKWTDIITHNIEIERIGYDDKVQYILTESESEESNFRVMMLTGEARNYNIGLQQPQEIPRQLEGYALWHDISDISQISDIKMRVERKYSKEANEYKMDFNETCNMIQDWLRQRGWLGSNDGGDDNGNGDIGDIESFEKGYFDEPWRTYGYGSWFVTSYESNTGNYSARAGDIDDDEVCSLELVADCKQGMIRFYKKVSCEENFDFLRFYIDGTEMGRWSGKQDWERVAFPVNAGIRTFRWDYVKDDFYSRGDDTAYIDDVELSD
jgi:hypothetical protein